MQHKKSKLLPWIIVVRTGFANGLRVVEHGVHKVTDGNDEKQGQGDGFEEIG